MPRRAVAAQPGGAPRWRARTSRTSYAERVGSAASGTSPICSTATRSTGPEMLRAWAAGQDTDGSERPLPADAAWQAELWRRLRERIAQPSPAERLGGACAACATSRRSSSCPQRFSLFGLTRLPAGQLQVLRALAAAPRRSPVPAASVAGAVGAHRQRGPAAAADRPPRATTRRRARRPTACSPPGATTRARCSSCSPAAEQVTSTTTTRSTTAIGHAARAHPGRRAGEPRPAGLPLAGERRRSPAARPRRREPAGPRLSRPRPPGRGRARRDPAPARGGPDARAARRDRDVPGHRDLRAAHPRHLRRRRGARRRRARRAAADIARPTCGSGWPTARCARPTRCSASSRS